MKLVVLWPLNFENRRYTPQTIKSSITLAVKLMENDRAQPMTIFKIILV